MIDVESGFDTVYDSASQGLVDAEDALEHERKDASREIGCRIQFKNLGKELFQMEVPVKQKVPAEWTQMSKTASVYPFHTHVRLQDTGAQKSVNLCKLLTRQPKSGMKPCVMSRLDSTNTLIVSTQNGSM